MEFLPYHSVNSGQWTVDSGQWTVWTVDSGQWTVWTVDSVDSVDSGQ
jgi:hypothetical protein